MRSLVLHSHWWLRNPSLSCRQKPWWRVAGGVGRPFSDLGNIGIDIAEPLPRTTRSRKELLKRDKIYTVARPEASPKRKARRGQGKSKRVHSTDLEDLGRGPSTQDQSPSGSSDVTSGEKPRLPRTLAPNVSRLIRRPIAELPRKPEFFVKFGPPMRAEDLSCDAPSIFVESRRLMDDVLERRKAAQPAPDHVAPDTPFWRVPPKLRAKKGVKWQEADEDEDSVGTVDPPRSEEEAAERLKGIVDVKIPGKRWQAEALSPKNCASSVMKIDTNGIVSGEEELDEPEKDTTLNGGHKQQAPTRKGTLAQNLIATIRSRAQEFAQTGVDPDIKSSLELALKHHPGTERAARLREMHACTKDFEALVMEGKASVRNFNELIRAQALQGRIDEAMRTHDAMKLHGFEPNADTFVSLLVGAAKIRDAELGRKLFLKMREQLISATPKVYSILIKTHVRSGDLASGFALLRKMEDERLKPDVVVYTVLIDGLVKEGKLEKAWEEFHAVRTWKLIAPDEVLFTVMIKACAQALEAERALNMLDDLRTSGLYPTDLTYGEVIHAVASSVDHARKAFDFFRQMQAEDMPISPFIWGQLLKACKSLGDVRKAREVVKEMNDHEVDLLPSMYCDLVGLFASAMRLTKCTDNERMQNLRCAWHVVAESRKRCSQESIDWVKMLNEVMDVYIAAKLPNYAVDMLQQYSIFGVKPDATTYQQLCELFGRELNDVGRFTALWDIMPKDPKPPNELYHLALEVAMESKSARRTCLVLEEMYAAQVFPSPQLTERLAKVGRNVIQIHLLVGKFIALNRDSKAAAARREQELLETHMRERDFELAAVGAHIDTPTPEQEVRAKHFASLHKRGWFRRPWLPLGEYIQSKQKGGEAYAKKHDRPRPNLLAA